MTIRHTVNNNFYRAEVEKFTTAMFFKKLTTVVIYRNDIIDIIVRGENVNSLTTFEDWEKIFTK